MAAPYNPPKKNEDFAIRIGLEDMLFPGSFLVDPIIEAGDFKIDLDGAGLTDLLTTPGVSPTSSVLVYVILAAAEMNADIVTLVAIDQSVPKEWADVIISIPTTA